MSYMNHDFATQPSGIVALNFDEIDLINGASRWGDYVLVFGGVGGGIGGLIAGPPGVAAGVIVGAVFGTAVAIFDD